MSINMSVGQTGLFWCAGRGAKGANPLGNGQSAHGGGGCGAGSVPGGGSAANGCGGANADSSVRSIRRMLSGDSRENTARNMAFSNDAVSSTLSYSDTIRASRAKAKDTALKLKKLRYDFKSISKQIMRSKTSTSARQVAGKARREVIRLKRQKQSGEYDSEELQAAIVHAQAMERVAKKKARHLLEEELVKVTGGPCLGDLEEREEQRSDAEAAEEAIAEFEEGGGSAMPEGSAISDDQTRLYQEAMQAQTEELQKMMQLQMEELQQEMEQTTAAMQEELAASVDEMMSDMSESMEELLEESGLEELSDSMFAAAEPEMDPADYKLMKLKHRLKEMKLIAEADAEYLKAIFDQLEKAKGAGMPDLSGSNGSSGLGGVTSGGGGFVFGGSGHAAQEALVQQINASVSGSAGGASEAAAGASVDILI